MRHENLYKKMQDQILIDLFWWLFPYSKRTIYMMVLLPIILSITKNVLKTFLFCIYLVLSDSFENEPQLHRLHRNGMKLSELIVLDTLHSKIIFKRFQNDAMRFLTTNSRCVSSQNFISRVSLFYIIKIWNFQSRY
jgi:hypothetical protein